MEDKNSQFWDQYNKERFKLGFQNLFNKNKFLDTQVAPYDQINDFRSITIILLQIFLKKINILDYGGGLVSFAYLYKKNQKKYRNRNFFKNSVCDIYNPHINFLDLREFKKFEKIISLTAPINFIKKIHKTKKYDLVLFGSCIQYLKNLKNLNYLFKKKPKFVLITHTPLSINNRTYIFSQGTQSIPKYIHSIKNIKFDLLDSKYEIVYISNIDPKLSGLKKKEYLKKVEYLNILLMLKK